MKRARANFQRRCVTFAVALATAVAPSLSLAAPAKGTYQITSRAARIFQGGNYTRALTLARYGVGSLALGKKAMNFGQTAGHSVVNDVFQASLIMFFAATAQLTKDRMEKDRILEGHELKFEEVKTYSVQAAEDLLCSSSASKAGVRGEVLCSGEFWMGVMGGWGARIGVQATVMQVLKFLLKKSPTRVALIQTVGSFAASALTLGGFAMSSHLWSEATQIAITDPEGSVDKQKEQLSHNLFGRALEHWIAGDWQDYIATPDGKLADEVFQNMNNILVVDSSLRSAWLYNGWRFGVARGELIVNLSVLMAALSAGSAVGASAGGLLATAVGATGGTAVAIGAAVSFTVATAFGVGVSYATVYFPDYEIGARVTRAIQNTRGWFAGNTHRAAQGQVTAVAEAFTPNSRFLYGINTPAQLLAYKKSLPRRLADLRNQREGWTNIAMEKYFELSKVVEDAQTKVSVIQEVLTSSKLRDTISVREGGEFMSLAEARQKHCPPTNSNCDFPLSYQLQKLADVQRTIAEGNVTLAEIADEILVVYDSDETALKGIMDNENVHFPVELSELAVQLRTEMDTVDVVRQILSTDFASLHETIRQKYQVQFETGELRVSIATQSKDIFGHLYLHGLNDSQMYSDMVRSLSTSTE